MEKTIKLLTLLLGVQLLLALGLGLSGQVSVAHAGKQTLVDVAKDKVDRLVLEEPDKPRLVLVKRDGVWRLPEADDFPADARRVAQLLDKLAGLKPGVPVAASTGAQQRFKVSEDAFERRITLGADGKTLVTLYLGTSPAVRRLHARAGDDDAIYAVELALHEIPVRAADWQDKTVLRIPAARVEAIQVADLNLRRSGETEDAPWQADGLADGQRPNAEAVAHLTNLIAELTIGEILGREAVPEYGMDAPVLKLTVTRRGGEVVDYALGKAKDKEEYTLKASSRPEYFRLPAFTAHSLIDASKRETLLETVEEKAEENTEENAGKPAS